MSFNHRRLGKTLTTGEIARMCDVSMRLVSMWIDRGELRGVRLPSGTGGFGDRRVPRAELVRFMREHGFPLGDLAADAAHVVLALGLDALAAERLAAALVGVAELVVAETPFAAGVLLRDRPPKVVLIDDALGVAAARRTAAAVRADGANPAAVVAIVGEDYPVEVAGRPPGTQAVYQYPLDHAAIVAGVKRLIETPPEPVVVRKRKAGRRV